MDVLSPTIFHHTKQQFLADSYRADCLLEAWESFVLMHREKRNLVSMVKTYSIRIPLFLFARSIWVTIGGKIMEKLQRQDFLVVMPKAVFMTSDGYEDFGDGAYRYTRLENALK